MTRIDYEFHLDNLRNEARGFGVYIAEQLGSAIALYGETDEGEPMLVTWSPEDRGHYTVRTPDVSATSVDALGKGRGAFNPTRMVRYAIEHGHAVYLDDIARSDDPEQAAQQLEEYTAMTLEALQVAPGD